MVALNQIVVKSMLDAGLSPYGISPVSLFEEGKENVSKFNEAQSNLLGVALCQSPLATWYISMKEDFLLYQVTL